MADADGLITSRMDDLLEFKTVPCCCGCDGEGGGKIWHRLCVKGVTGQKSCKEKRL